MPPFAISAKAIRFASATACVAYAPASVPAMNQQARRDDELPIIWTSPSYASKTACKSRRQTPALRQRLNRLTRVM